VQEQFRNERVRSRTAEHSQLYWFTLPQGLRPVSFAPQAKKVPLYQLIVQFTINHTIPTPCKNQETHWIDQLLPAVPQSIQQTNKAKSYSLKQYEHSSVLQNYKQSTYCLIQKGSRKVKKDSLIGAQKMPLHSLEEFQWHSELVKSDSSRKSPNWFLIKKLPKVFFSQWSQELTLNFCNSDSGAR